MKIYTLYLRAIQEEFKLKAPRDFSDVSEESSQKVTRGKTLLGLNWRVCHLVILPSMLLRPYRNNRGEKLHGPSILLRCVFIPGREQTDRRASFDLRFPTV